MRVGIADLLGHLGAELEREIPRVLRSLDGSGVIQPASEMGEDRDCESASDGGSDLILRVEAQREIRLPPTMGGPRGALEPLVRQVLLVELLHDPRFLRRALTALRDGASDELGDQLVDDGLPLRQGIFAVSSEPLIGGWPLEFTDHQELPTWAEEILGRVLAVRSIETALENAWGLVERATPSEKLRVGAQSLMGKFEQELFDVRLDLDRATESILSSALATLRKLGVTTTSRSERESLHIGSVAVVELAAVVVDAVAGQEERDRDSTVRSLRRRLACERDRARAGASQCLLPRRAVAPLMNPLGQGGRSADA